MKIAFVLIGSLSLVARVVSNQQTIQNGIDEVNQYISGSHQVDLSGVLYLLRNNGLISYDDYNVFLGALNNQQAARKIAKVVLEHLQIDLAILEINDVRSQNSGDALFNALNTLLNKDLFKQALLSDNDQQAFIKSLNNQVAPGVVAKAAIKHLQFNQAMDVLKTYQLGDSGSNTLTNVLTNDLVNEGLISHQHYGNLKSQLKGGKQPNQVANEAVGLLHKENDVQNIIHNVPYDQAIQVLKNYRSQNSGDENALFNILHNDFINEGVITQEDYSNFKNWFGDSPIDNDPNKLANRVIVELNNRRRVQSD